MSIYHAVLAPWYGKLQWLRLPVLPIEEFEGIFRQLVAELESSPETMFPRSEISEYLESLTEELFKVMRDKLGQISPSGSDISFESVCEQLITEWGYSIEGRNIFDGEGGDIDRICVRERSSTSPFESGQVTLLVQIKKHVGTTDKKAVEQIQRMMRERTGADGCVMSLANDFSREAIELAEEHGILLLNGEALCRLLLQFLGRRPAIE